MFFNDGGEPWSLQGWASDARFVYCGVTMGTQHLVLCGGSYLEVDGQRQVFCKSPATRLEWINDGVSKRFSCSSEIEITESLEDALSDAGAVPLIAGAQNSRNTVRK